MAKFPTEFVSRREFVRLSAITGATLAVPGLAACGGDDEPKPSAGPQQFKGTLSFIKGPHSEQDAQFQQLYAREFNERFSNLQIKPSFYDWTSIDADLTAAFAGPTPPDVSYLVSRIWGKFAQAGALLDLTDFVKDPTFAREYEAIPQTLWDSITYEGKIYGVPLLGAAFPIFANLDLLEKAGAGSDWNGSIDSFLEAATATHSGNTFGFVIGQTLAEEAYHDLQPYIHNGGGTLFSEDGRSGNLEHDGVVEAFEALRRLHEAGVVPRPGLYDAQGKQALFAAGRAAIGHIPHTIILDFEKKKPDFKWDMFLPPKGTDGQSVGGDYGYLCIASKTKSPEAAWEYIKYYAGAAHIADYVTKLGRTLAAARTDVVDQVYPAGTSPEFKRLQEEFAPVVKPYSAHPKQIDALRVVVGGFEEMVRGKLSARDAVAQANQKITELATA